MKSINKTAAVLLSAAFVAVSAPALAGGDYLHYEKNRASYITHEKAAQIAVAKVGGGQATDVEFDRSRNKPDHFDMDVRMANGQKYEVKVDAKTGAVLSSKLDD